MLLQPRTARNRNWQQPITESETRMKVLTSWNNGKISMGKG
jgi:hypothetical protein